MKRSLAAITAAATFALTMVGALGVRPAAAASTIWESQQGGWKGQGAQILPGIPGPGGGRPDRATPPDCPECVYFSDAICEFDARGVCAPMTGLPGCPDGVVVNYSVIRPGRSESEHLSQRCQAPGDRPVSIEELGLGVARIVKETAPKLTVAYQPPGGAITQLPAIFRTGQPTVIERTDDIAGFSVQFTARPRWTWTWGDGKVTQTSKPGGVWPDMSVSHTYRRPGQVRVQVTTSWSAQFTVDGAGPFSPAGATVSQSATTTVPVREARAELITP